MSKRRERSRCVEDVEYVSLGGLWGCCTLPVLSCTVPAFHGVGMPRFFAASPSSSSLIGSSSRVVIKSAALPFWINLWYRASNSIVQGSASASSLSYDAKRRSKSFNTVGSPNLSFWNSRTTITHERVNGSKTWVIKAAIDSLCGSNRTVIVFPAT